MDLRATGNRLAPYAGATVALVLGLVLLGRKSLWTDEAVAVETARQPFGELARFVVEDAPASAGYLLLLHPIVRLDDAEWVARLPSVLSAALAALAMFALGASLFGRLAGILASLTLATAAGVVAASQQARPLPLAILAITVTALCFVRALARRGWWWVAFVLSVVLLPLSHPIAASVLLALAAALAFHPERRALLPAGIAALASATALSLAPLGAAAVDRVRDPHDGRQLDVGDLGAGLAHAVGWSPALALLGVLGLVGIATGRTPGSAVWKAMLVGGMIVAPVLVLLAAGVVMPVFATRALLASTPGLALASAAALGAIADRAGRMIAAAVLFAIAAVGVCVWLAGPALEDWRAATTSVLAHRRPDESTVVLPPRAAAAFTYYAPELSLSGQARGEGAWVLVTSAGGSNAVAAARKVVKTPRYALLSQVRQGPNLVLQHWIRP